MTHPNCQTGEQKRRADVYLKGGKGRLLRFCLSRGRAAGQAVIEALKMFYHVANSGDASSTAIYLASITHS
ncbi:MAG: hypothetical protein VX900_04545 [Pseudomonadota bacterium]|nr:hypothetical protein [Pseudomonadota bacterium]